MRPPTGPKIKESVDLEALITRAQDRLRPPSAPPDAPYPVRRIVFDRKTGTIIVAFVLALLASFLVGCDETPNQKLYAAYRSERTLTKVCRDGTMIWRWRGQLYVHDRKQWPDAMVDNSADAVCQ